MTTNFDRLAPFIREYIYKERWDTLHAVQEAACDVIFDTTDHLLLLTPTASGKTEAAFLPILTDVVQNPSESVAVLYIAPLKALINDQFYRLEAVLKKSHVKLTKWHGDASRTEKDKLIKNPSGILQITPESLEAMLMTKKNTAEGLFGELRYIVIDEMHNFMASDRGVQLSALLERIGRLAKTDPRRVGLSATLSDVESAKKWLSMGSERVVRVPQITLPKRKAKVWVSHFFSHINSADEIEDTQYYDHLYRLTQNKKSIIFSNRRSEVEHNISHLKLMASERHEKDIFHVHHGSISKTNREHTETQMKTSQMPIATGATVTLELGIDLGNLDRVIQTGSPHSVSSLAQRLGRSGRRKNEYSEMFFVFKELPEKKGAFYKQINWEFLKCVALIELYRQGFVEPIPVQKLPYNILLHQTLSILRSEGAMSPAQLASCLLTLDTFSQVSKADYQVLLRHMLTRGLIEKTDEGTILFGAKGEQLINHYDFFTVFETPIEYTVKEGTKEIGLLYTLMPVGERFLLSGRTWEVIEVDTKSSSIYVKFVGGMSSISWDSEGMYETNTTVLRAVYQVLTTDEVYGYLDEPSKQRLVDSRKGWHANIKPQTQAIQMTVFLEGEQVVGIFHWLGTRALKALILALATRQINLVEKENPHVDLVIFVSAPDVETVWAVLVDIKEKGVNPAEITVGHVPAIGKYTTYLPDELKEKQFLEGFVDFGGIFA